MLIYALYRTATSLGSRAVDLLLAARLKRGKEDPGRLEERRGLASLARPAGPLVWFHGASIGEANALLPVMERCRDAFPDVALLLTTGTRTSADLVVRRLPRGTMHQYIPVDIPTAAAAFFDHWRPSLMIWTESDLWPNLLMEAERRSVPRLLLNGRLSARSFSRWRFGRGLIEPLLSGFALCLGQTDADAARLQALGARNTACVGNLKLAVPPPPADADDLARARSAVNGRPCWIMASTHRGEEDLAGRVHATLKTAFPGLLTIVVPRHADRADDIAARLRATGLSVSRRSDALPGPDTDIWLGDTMGEMGLYYRLAPIAVMGKTFPDATQRTGGQNPLEPAWLDTALLWGPGMENFSTIAAALEATGGAERVADGPALIAALDRLLRDPDEVARRAAAAGAWARSRQQVLTAVMARITPYLTAITATGTSAADLRAADLRAADATATGTTAREGTFDARP